MAAELRLNVALDLQYFKQQLPKLSQAAAGFRLPIQVKFDRRSINNEFRLLGQQFSKRRNYTIQVNDYQLGLARDKAEKLVTYLKTNITGKKHIVEIEYREKGRPESAGGSSGGGGVAGATGTFRQRLERRDKAELAKLYEAAAIAGLTAFDKAIVNNKGKLVTKLNQAGEDGVLGFINGINSGDEKVKKASEFLGKELLTSLRKTLKSQSPSREMLAIGRDAVIGFEIGLTGGLRSLRPRAVREMRNLVAALQFEASKLMMPAMGARAGSGAMFAPGRQGILPPAGMGRLDLNARPLPGAPRIASVTGATGAMSALPSSAVARYKMSGRQLALPSAEMRAALAEVKVKESAAAAGKELTKSLKEAAASMKTKFGALVPNSGIAFAGRNAGYTRPIGPLPLGSTEPWAKSFGPGFMGGGFEPRMESRTQSLRSMFDGVKPLQAPAIGNQLSEYVSSQIAKAMETLGIGRSSGRIAGLLPSQEMRFAQRTAAAQARGGSTGEFFAGGSFGGGGGGRPPQNILGGAGFSGGGGSGGGGLGGRLAGIYNQSRGLGNFLNELKPGPIASIGKELSYATSQVLLFGTAYKAIAAVTALPGNIAKAAANLQAFNNQMEAVTGGGPVMTSSMKLIEDTVNRFNIPVQSARDGFVRLYASMQPAGIDLSTINNVFTGLSATASTFGMSADQVDRMTYALAQMASKGQIMTEELKGQLGDVFPQAVSLFAEAAGFLDESMDEQARSKGLAAFLEALEDGALKGEAMSAVLSNVGSLLNTKFAPSAEKAAGSFQNQMNKLNNSLNDFYESFAPAAGAFLGEFVNPVVAALKVAEDAIRLALSDESLGNNELAGYLRNELFPQLINVKDAILAGAQTFGIFAQAISVVLRPIAQFIIGNEQLVRVVARAAVVAAVFKAAVVGVRVTGIIPLIRSIVLFNKTFRIFIAQSASGVKGMTAMRTAAIATGQSFRQAAVGVRILATAIRTALVASAIGIALVAIGALIEKIMQLKATAASIEGQRGGAGSRIRKAAEMGGSEAMEVETSRVQSEITSRQKSIKILEKLNRKESITQEEHKQLKATGSVPSGLLRGDGDTLTAASLAYSGGGRFQTNISGDVQTVLDNNRKSLEAFTEGMNEQMVAAAKNAAVVDKRFTDQAKIKAIDFSGGDDGASGGKSGGKTGRQDLSPEMVAIRERLREINRGLLLDQEGVNEFMKVEAELALEIQRIKESDQGIAEKTQAIEDARFEAEKNKAALIDSSMKDLVEALQKEEDARKYINDLIRENDFASGELTEEEYKKSKHIEKQKEDLAEIARLRREGLITPEFADQATASITANVFKPEDKSFRGGISDWIEKTEKELEDFNSMAESAADGIASEFGTAFSGILQGTTSLQEGLGQAFTNIGKMFADMVAQMLVKYAMLQLMKGLFPGMAEGGVVNASSGGGIAAVPGFATGGIVQGPTLAMVGEGRFNEAVVPLPNGKAIPVDMNGGAGNNISTNITVNVSNGQVSSKSSGAQGNDLARNLEGAVKQVIMREMQPGGMISKGR